MQDRMVRFLQPGSPPKNLILPSFNSTLEDVFALGAGGGKVPDGHTGTINGKPADSKSAVKPGDTVAYQPNARHG